MTSGKTIALTRQTFVGKVMSLLFNMLSRLVITFLLRSKHLLISWLQSVQLINTSHLFLGLLNADKQQNLLGSSGKTLISKDPS